MTSLNKTSLECQFAYISEEDLGTQEGLKSNALPKPESVEFKWGPGAKGVW